MLESVLFGIVGTTNTAIDLAIFFLLVHFCHFDVILSQVVSYTCGLVNSYFLNRAVTFQKRGKPQFREMIRFIALNMISCGASVGVLAASRHIVGSTLVSKFLATGATLVINFVGSKWWVFRRRVPTTTIFP